jgi:hypothetical protein
LAGDVRFEKKPSRNGTFTALKKTPFGVFIVISRCDAAFGDLMGLGTKLPGRPDDGTSLDAPRVRVSGAGSGLGAFAARIGDRYVSDGIRPAAMSRVCGAYSLSVVV